MDFARHYSEEEIKKMLKSSDFEVISLDANPYEICELSDGHYVSANTGSVTILDENFKIIKKHTIVGSVVGLVLRNDNIFITDDDHHGIHMMDLHLNIIKSFGSKGSGKNNFNNPLSMSISKDHLYICDWGNKRIQILDIALNIIDAFKLDYRPVTIKVSDSTIGVCGDCGVYFYDLNTKTLKNQHLGIVGRMNCIGSNFYVALSSPTKRILCFDQNGNLLEEIVDIKFEILLTNWSDGFMLNCGLKKDFLVSFRTNQKIIRFKI